MTSDTSDTSDFKSFRAPNMVDVYLERPGIIAGARPETDDGAGAAADNNDDLV